MANGTPVGFYGGPLQGPHATVNQNPMGPLVAAGAQPITPPPTPNLYDQFGRVIPPTNDPAWTQHGDPLRGKSVDAIRASASLIYRDIPSVTVQNSWTVAAVRGAIEQLSIGLFDAPSQLCDAIVADDRVQATLGSRTGGLLGRPVKHTLPPGYEDNADAKACRDAWAKHWPALAAEAEVSEIQRWGIMLGFAPAQVLWDTVDDDLWLPYLYPWYPRYVYYHWLLRHYVAITLDGQVPITPGDGHWLLHAPHGAYRGWMRGAIRATAEPWLRKTFAWRDASRWSERHGMPIVKAKTPAAADQSQVNQFRAALANLGQETVIQVPQGVDAQFSYDLEIMEASSQSWQGFGSIINGSDMQIVLALLYQNLTTEVKEGSYAAARVHGDVRQGALEADNHALGRGTIYNQLSRPFAAINFGDPNLATITEWDVAPFEDAAAQASTFHLFAMALQQLRTAGKEVTNADEMAKDFGVKMITKNVEPVQVEAKAVGVTGKP